MDLGYLTIYYLIESMSKKKKKKTDIFTVRPYVGRTYIFFVRSSEALCYK